MLTVVECDVLMCVLLYLDGYALSRISLVNRYFSAIVLAYGHTLWHKVCTIALPNGTVMRNLKMKKLRKVSEIDWRLVFMNAVQCRFDGVYVLSVKYLTPGSPQKQDRLPNVLEYHRYLRFFPKNKVLYALLNYDLKHAKQGIVKAARMNGKTYHVENENEKMFWGKYKISGNNVHVQVDIGHLIIRFKLNFASTRVSQNDRLELIEFFGYKPTDKNQDELIEFPSPNPWFEFQRVSW
jgi:hypothetical protein